MSEVRLITLDPGHFHAALVQKEMYPGVARRAHVYGPFGPDLLAHLGRVAGFNTRRERPTDWELEVHAGPDFAERALAERPGNVVVLSGRNRDKIAYVLAAVRAGLNVLADKPWVIRAEDLPRLEDALNTAEAGGLVAYDIMTERFEITSILQRELVNDAATFGALVPGTEEEPGVFMESVHFLMKTVAGVPLRRPAWFFDTTQQGEGLTDVGTHLVDLVMWILFPERAIDRHRDLRMVAARRWPTRLTPANFQRVTGEPGFPDYLTDAVREGRLDYYCNTLVSYTMRGVHVKLNVLWDFEAAAGAGDTHLAVVRGTRSRVEVRQGKDENYRPELFVVPNTPAERGAVEAALGRKVAALQKDYPGLGVQAQPERFWVTIPDTYRVGHEAHFGEVARQFLRYLDNPASIPAWEKANMLAKYHVTTEGVRLAQQTEKACLPRPALSEPEA
ncbi:MAG: oxidoreductase [Gemmataceae bacterium]|nr:oxidoreductase [Gemmataceae bacterium]